MSVRSPTPRAGVPEDDGHHHGRRDGRLAPPRGAAAALGHGPAVGKGVIGANDRIRVALVGVKGMGAGHIKHILEGMPDANVQIAAVCDVWEKARLTAKEAACLQPDQVYADYRRMLDAKDLDAVIVATPDHTHAPISIDVMESGRDLTCRSR
jgi:hypothetical protein